MSSRAGAREWPGEGAGERPAPLPPRPRQPHTRARTCSASLAAGSSRREEGGGRAGDEGGDRSLKDASKDPGALALETAPGLRVVGGGESVPEGQAGVGLSRSERGGVDRSLAWIDH